MRILGASFLLRQLFDMQICKITLKSLDLHRTLTLLLSKTYLKNELHSHKDRNN